LETSNFIAKVLYPSWCVKLSQ